MLLASGPLLAAAFPWLEMSAHADWARVPWVPLLSGFKATDALLNFLITIPIGVAAAVVARRPFLTAVSVTTVVSVVCEFAQVYAPDRFPSTTDVFCNGAGAVFGVHLLKARWPERSARLQHFLTRNPPLGD